MTWIQTFTGKKFYPLAPRPEDICIEDIAHALALKCRYSGHCLTHYSVAEHSVLVSRNVPPEYRLSALLHDSAEYVLPDIPSPIKPEITGFAAIEERLGRVIAQHFDVPFWDDIPAIAEIDKRIRLDEKKVLFRNHRKWEHEDHLQPLGISLPLWPWLSAKQHFIAEYRRIIGELK